MGQADDREDVVVSASSNWVAHLFVELAYCFRMAVKKLGKIATIQKASTSSGMDNSPVHESIEEAPVIHDSRMPCICGRTLQSRRVSRE
jgi:hypothetical protein